MRQTYRAKKKKREGYTQYTYIFVSIDRQTRKRVISKIKILGDRKIHETREMIETDRKKERHKNNKYNVHQTPSLPLPHPTHKILVGGGL